MREYWTLRDASLAHRRMGATLATLVRILQAEARADDGAPASLVFDQFLRSSNTARLLVSKSNSGGAPVPQGGESETCPSFTTTRA